MPQVSTAFLWGDLCERCAWPKQGRGSPVNRIEPSILIEISVRHHPLIYEKTTRPDHSL